MRKLITVLSLLALLSAVCAMPVQAKSPVGERINLWFSGETEYPADTPFHILHGHQLFRGDTPIGVFDFLVYLDGQPVASSFLSTTVEHDPWALSRLRGFNFPAGMTGTQTLVGSWIAPCQWAVNFGYEVGQCAFPAQPVEIKRTTVIVTFVGE